MIRMCQNSSKILTNTRKYSRANSNLPVRTVVYPKTILLVVALLCSLPCFAQSQSADDRLRTIYTKESKWRLEQSPGLEGVYKPVPDRLPNVDPATEEMRLK